MRHAMPGTRRFAATFLFLLASACSAGTADRSGDGAVSDGDAGEGGADAHASDDGGTTDGGATDGGTSDGATTDGATTDGSSGDSGTTDGATTDGATTDGATTDGATADGGDASMADAGGGDGGCTSDADCEDGVACTLDTCSSGACVRTIDATACVDDGLFCNGGSMCAPGSAAADPTSGCAP